MNRLLLAGLLLPGCVYTTRMGDFSMMANENIPIRTEVLSRAVTGEDCKLQMSMGMFPSIEAAVSRVQQQVPEGQALQNVVVEYTTQYRFFNYNCYRVTADVVRLSAASQAAAR